MEIHLFPIGNTSTYKWWIFHGYVSLPEGICWELFPKTGKFKIVIRLIETLFVENDFQTKKHVDCVSAFYCTSPKMLRHMSKDVQSNNNFQPSQILPTKSWTSKALFSTSWPLGRPPLQLLSAMNSSPFLAVKLISNPSGNQHLPGYKLTL